MEKYGTTSHSLYRDSVILTRNKSGFILGHSNIKCKTKFFLNNSAHLSVVFDARESTDDFKDDHLKINNRVTYKYESKNVYVKN